MADRSGSPTKLNRGLKFFVAGLLSLVLSAGLLITGYIDKTHSIEQALITSCEKNGNPLREGLREEKEKELQRQQKFGLKAYEEFFPNVPVQKLKRLRRESNAEIRYNINVRYKEVNCEEIYG